MQCSPAGKEFIKRFEGFRTSAYQDSAGIWTIGWGSTRYNGMPVQPGLIISVDQATQMFLQDLQQFEATIQNFNAHLLVKLTQHQFDALVSFAYNVGGHAFNTSTLRRMIESGDLYGAQMQFLRWNKSNKRPIKGLSRRRFAEALLFGPRDKSQLSAAIQDPDVRDHLQLYI